MNHRVSAYLALLLGVIALSTSAIFVKIADAPSSVTAFYRLSIAALVLGPFLIFDREKCAELRSLKPGQIGPIVLSGLLLAVHYVMWFASLRYTSVSSSTVLVALQPLFSLVLPLYFSGRRPEAARLSDA